MKKTKAYTNLSKNIIYSSLDMRDGSFIPLTEQIFSKHYEVLE